jgi:ABC-type nitrate/sulfonate/bicarbonate transport system substrate-binding protein
MLKIMQRNLNDVGITNIVTAIDGNDGIRKLKANSIDMIISDWNMPDMDGYEFLKWVRQDENFKGVPFVMATAQADKTQQLAVEEAGGNGLIAKPFDEAELKNCIDEIFGGKKEAVEKRERKVVAGKVQLKMAHIQITDHLVLGMLKHQIDTGQVTPKYFDLELQRMPGWNPVVKSLEQGQVDGAFVLAPIAMDLFGFDVPINLVLLAHKNGSIFVRSKNFSLDDYEGSKTGFYKYKVIDIPHKMSIHNMLAHKYLSEIGLKPGVPGKKMVNVRFEVVPPVQMPQIMKDSDSVGGFIVAEPIGSNAIAKGIAELEFISSTLWDDHPCCVCAVQRDFINQHPDAVYEFTQMLVEAGKAIERNKAMAAEIAVPFLDPEKKLGLTTDMLSRVLEMPKGISMNDLYPVIEDLDKIQQYMHNQMDIGVIIDLEKFVDLRFANEACK